MSKESSSPRGTARDDEEWLVKDVQGSRGQVKGLCHG